MSIRQSTPLRACLVMRAPLARYPPSVFQAEMLEEAGVSVTVLDTEDGAHHACALRTSIRRVVLERAPDPWAKQRFSNRLTSPVRRWLFSRRAAYWLKKLSPDVVIAYEPAAIAGVGQCVSAGRSVQVWHFHEYPEVSGPLSWGSRADLEWARRNIAIADMTIFPDARRAEQFAQEMSLTTELAVVMNCPRRLSELPVPILRDRLNALGCPPAVRTVLYVGAIGPTHGLEATVRSMKHWPSDTWLVAIGSGMTEFKEHLSELAASSGVRGRVVFTGVAAPSDIWGLRAGADVAITIMEPTGVNRRLSAGASNKRFEAMAAGVAQVSDCNPGVPEFVEQTGAGLCVPHDDPDAIGRAAAKLLQDVTLRKTMGVRARRLHLERFNYETGFQSVLEALIQRMQQRSTGFQAVP